MKKVRLWVILGVLVFVMGCGSNPDPIRTPPGDAEGRPATVDTGNHTLWGYYALSFDLETLEVRAVPDRAALAHWNVAGLLSSPGCSDCLVMNVISHEPSTHTISIQVSIRNPTGRTGYDVRGILLPKVGGVYLANVDSYTNLWNQGAASTRNPFLAFAKGAERRAFGPGVGHTRLYEIVYDSVHALRNTSYAIDVSWPDNCHEPYEIVLPATPEFIGQEPTVMEINVPDWQDDVDWVLMYPYPLALTNYNDYIQMQNDWGDTWSATFNNVNEVIPTTYFLWVQAKSSDSETVIWNRLQVNVMEPPPGPKDIVCKYYVAADSDGSLPYYCDPFGPNVWFCTGIIEMMRGASNIFWNKYGLNLVDDGTVKVMDDEDWYDWQFYDLDDYDEVLEMHQYYGKTYTPYALNMYFVQGLPPGLETAFATWPEVVDSLEKHVSKEVFVVYCPNVWSWSEVMAHECGHAFGALEDIYLLLPPMGFDCDKLKEESPPKFQYLYCDDNAYYAGNLMYYAMGWNIDDYDLTEGQAEWVEAFHEEYPNNW